MSNIHKKSLQPFKQKFSKIALKIKKWAHRFLNPANGWSRHLTIPNLFISLLVSWWAVSPAITIEPGITLNGKDAFETRFFAQNQRPYIITNWHYYCTVRVPDAPNQQYHIMQTNVDGNTYARLGPFAKSSLLCDQQAFDGKSIDHALLAVSVNYKLPFIFLDFDVTDSSIFFLKRDSEGNAQWLPVDGGQNLGDMFNFLKNLPIP